MIKKRIFFVFCALCLFFVSCKSNPTVDSVENEEKIETEVDSIDEQTETENLFEDENETESESSESVDEIGEDEDSVEEYLTDDSTIFDEPDIELEFEQELNDEENEDEDEDRFEDKIAAESDEANESSAGIELLTETNESNAESELENDSDPENNLILLEELEQAIKNTTKICIKICTNF